MEGVFAAGDCRRGQSLIVWGIQYVARVVLSFQDLTDAGVISEGRGAAAEVDAWLSGGSTRLPKAGGIKARVSVRACFLNIISERDWQNFIPPPSTLPARVIESEDEN